MPPAHSQGYRLGTISEYDDRAGYGRVSPDAPSKPGESLLVHRRSLHDPATILRPGDRVRFIVKEVPRGLLAADVSIEEEADANTLQQAEEEALRADTGAKDGETARPFPSTSRGYLGAALLAQKDRRWDEAIALYEEGLAKYPSIQLVLSYAAMEKNRHRGPAAMNIYRRGILLIPNSAKLREDAGILAADLGRYREAISFLDEALELSRSTDHVGEKGILLGLARTYYRINELGNAVRCYEDAMRLFGRWGRPPQSDMRTLHLARIRKQHHRGQLSFGFFSNPPFQIVRAELLDQITFGADFVVRVESAELAESYGLSGELLVRAFFKAEVTQNDLQDIDGKIAAWGGSGFVDEQVALLIVASLSANLERTLFKRIEERSKQLPALIPIPQELIETNRDRLAVLRGVLDRWLYRRDLFALNSPVSGRRFFGRGRPLAELREAIQSGTPAGVYGLRKVGKTSLLKEIERRQSEAGDIVVHLDLLRLPEDVSDTRWLYWFLADRLRERAERAGVKSVRWRLGGVFPDFFEVPPDFPAATAFDADLMQLLRALANSSVGHA